MAANFDTPIYEIKQAIPWVGRPADYEKHPESASALQAGLGNYNQYFKIAKDNAEFPKDPRVTSYDTFREFVTGNDLKIILNFFEGINHPQDLDTRRQKAPANEDSTVPANLAELVAIKEKNDADKELSSNRQSVEELVKRARETWGVRHRRELIEKNREEYQKQSDAFFAENIDPKTGDRETSFRQAEYVAYKVVQAQALNLDLKLTDQEIRQSVDDVLYLATAGAVDIDNLYELNIASQAAFRNLEGRDFSSPISKIDVENPYTDDQKIDEALAENYYQTSTKILSKRIHDTDLDFEENVLAAKKKLTDIQHNLATAIPDAKLPNTPLQDHGAALESAIRQADPSMLGVNPTPASAQTAALLKTTKSEERDISSGTVLLAGLGLTAEKFKTVETLAKNDPNSQLGILYRKNPDVFDQVRFQLHNLQNTKLGQEVTAKALEGLPKSFTVAYNQINNPLLQGAAKIALDPVGATRNWVSRQVGKNIGNQLIKMTGSDLAQKLGGYLLKDGLTAGVKGFASEAAQKLALKAAGWAATKLGISVALESASPFSFGVTTLIDIATQIALWLAEKTIGSVYSAFQNAARSIYGEEIKAQDLAAAAGILGGGALAAGITLFGGLRLAGAAARAALISATGIIILTLIVIGLYLGMIFLVAPILSTLVQLDSVEKVNYSVVGGTTTSCANTQGIYVSQRNPSWSHTYCSNCSTSGSCNIGGSGCSSASMTMILNAFGAKDSVVSVWNKQHSIGGYVYWDNGAKVPPYSGHSPYMNCGSDNSNSLGILKDAGLAVTDIGGSLAEADKTLKDCHGLVLATGLMKCGAGWCGHLLVILAHNGNQITTDDPWAGENFVHTLGSTYQITRMWAVTK